MTTATDQLRDDGVRALRDDELDEVTGGIIAVLIGLSFSSDDILTTTAQPNGHVKVF